MLPMCERESPVAQGGAGGGVRPLTSLTMGWSTAVRSSESGSCDVEGAHGVGIWMGALRV